MTQLTLAMDRDDRSAVISPCGAYRYRLGRRWGEGPSVLWICLNPSTADATRDDPTLRRLIGFSRAWGYGGLRLGNLFALRSTDPHELYRAPDPIGPDNDDHLRAMAGGVSLIVAAWGNHGIVRGRGRVVRSMFPGMKVLGLTKIGEPRHPLYAAGDLTPIDWGGATKP